ncbi:uncharacterized protein AMSG_03484 [Thecamonas trahens ATCC 50062]|uniref:Uncharacterized protein n=1 Tax=Thecamonas trahens ATCC 50062 TaxID=461836 RepID=A0A0L0D4B1_THETB|nr:hypothetical protein AMSG_03484 [Thecamonas trahens ATCC 50062]KNC47060.1 hypothetical protein AMSG_03484 [Thecamonas trahens ATCC 50062]|eukprot:XP_013759840.1 hypothetical protein AMSG_03484 [Thecamonas trahens ATCC 50062]
MANNPEMVLKVIDLSKCSATSMITKAFLDCLHPSDLEGKFISGALAMKDKDEINDVDDLMAVVVYAQLAWLYQRSGGAEALADLRKLVKVLGDAGAEAEAEGDTFLFNELSLFRCIIELETQDSPASMVSTVEALLDLALKYGTSLSFAAAASGLMRLFDADMGGAIDEIVLAPRTNGRGSKFTLKLAHFLAVESSACYAPPSAAGTMFLAHDALFRIAKNYARVWSAPPPAVLCVTLMQCGVAAFQTCMRFMTPELVPRAPVLESASSMVAALTAQLDVFLLNMCHNSTQMLTSVPDPKVYVLACKIINTGCGILKERMCSPAARLQFAAAAMAVSSLESMIGGDHLGEHEPETWLKRAACVVRNVDVASADLAQFDVVATAGMGEYFASLEPACLLATVEELLARDASPFVAFLTGLRPDTLGESASRLSDDDGSAIAHSMMAKAVASAADNASLSKWDRLRISVAAAMVAAYNDDCERAHELLPELDVVATVRAGQPGIVRMWLVAAAFLRDYVIPVSSRQVANALEALTALEAAAMSDWMEAVANNETHVCPDHTSGYGLRLHFRPLRQLDAPWRASQLLMADREAARQTAVSQRGRMAFLRKVDVGRMSKSAGSGIVVQFGVLGPSTVPEMQHFAEDVLLAAVWAGSGEPCLARAEIEPEARQAELGVFLEEVWQLVADVGGTSRSRVVLVPDGWLGEHPLHAVPTESGRLIDRVASVFYATTPQLDIKKGKRKTPLVTPALVAGEADETVLGTLLAVASMYGGSVAELGKPPLLEPSESKQTITGVIQLNLEDISGQRPEPTVVLPCDGPQGATEMKLFPELISGLTKNRTAQLAALVSRHGFGLTRVMERPCVVRALLSKAARVVIAPLGDVALASQAAVLAQLFVFLASEPLPRKNTGRRSE